MLNHDQNLFLIVCYCSVCLHWRVCKNFCVAHLHNAARALSRGTGNGERGTGNGERGTGNGERGTENGERGTGNGERGTGNGERGTGNGSLGTSVQR